MNPKGKAQCNAIMTLRGGKKVGTGDEEKGEENHEQAQKESKWHDEDEKEGELGIDMGDSTFEKKSEEEVVRKNRLNNLLSSTSQHSRFDPPPPFPLKKPKNKGSMLSSN